MNFTKTCSVEDDALAVQVAQPHQEALGDLLLQLEALLAVEVADREDPV